MHVVDNTNSWSTIFHQNEWGLSDKSGELTCSLISTMFTPHFHCLSEHFITLQNLSTISLDNCYLSSNFSCISHIGCGVCIFTRADLQYSTCDVFQFLIEKMFEDCASQLDLVNTSR